ncbi:MAG: PIG-L deacetylase family protein [Acidimicrobiales bacterium]|nr:PIG-L deacetylase family protein [Acidimicrobiales bacterium]
MLEDHEVERVLVVVAHPDDVDFGAAGSVARWTEAGASVSYCIVTDGDAGGFDPEVPRADIPGIRRQEQTAAAQAVGVDDLHFLGYPDGRLEVTLDVRRDISRIIRQTRPRRVVTQSPLRTLDSMYRNHPDHLAAGEATCCAVYPDARNPFTFPELVADGHEAWSADELWIMAGGGDADVHVDITATFGHKMKALRSHVSQHTGGPETEERLRGWNGHNAEVAGLGEGRLAEAFRVMDTR